MTLILMQGCDMLTLARSRSVRCMIMPKISLDSGIVPQVRDKLVELPIGRSNRGGNGRCSGDGKDNKCN